MAKVTSEKDITALLVIDPYNDFISEGGKVWDRLKDVAEANQCVPHMLQVLDAARKSGIRVFYALHRRYRPGDYETWKYIAPIQKAAWSRKTFEYGTWGGEIHREFEPQPGDIVALEHWGSSGFANRDLDLQLKRHGIHKLIVMGLIAHTCVEATVRYAAELGYEVTDLPHHFWGNPIWPFMRTSSFGCMIFDAVIAIWFLVEAPSLMRERLRAHLMARNL